VDNQQKRRFSAKRAIKQRDAVLEHLPRVFGRMKDADLNEIERRARMTAEPDGFSSGGSIEGSTSEVSDPTQAHAFRLIEGTKPQGDVQMEAFRRLDRAFQGCWDHVIEAEAAWDLIQHITDGRRGRETSLGTCQACLRSDVPNVGEDRIRAGYCNSCYRSWLRSDGGLGRMDRFSFELSRRQLEVVEEA
jgi:hypothetical protein